MSVTHGHADTNTQHMDSGKHTLPINATQKQGDRKKANAGLSIPRGTLTVPLSLRHEKVQREQESAVFPAAPRGTLFSLSLSPFCLHFCAGSRKPGVFFINTIKRADFCRRGLSPQTPLSRTMADSDNNTKTYRSPFQFTATITNRRQSGLAEAGASTMMHSRARIRIAGVAIAGHWHSAQRMMCILGTMPDDMTRATKWPWKRRR